MYTDFTLNMAKKITKKIFPEVKSVVCYKKIENSELLIMAGLQPKKALQWTFNRLVLMLLASAFQLFTTFR